MTKFFKYRQNNSGGRFVFDTARGLSVEVWFEASSPEQARERALKAGLYFDGAGDCSCCGSRWYDSPEEYDTAPAGVIFPTPWAKGDTAEGYVHYLDGRVEPLSFRSTR